MVRNGSLRCARSRVNRWPGLGRDRPRWRRRGVEALANGSVIAVVGELCCTVLWCRSNERSLLPAFLVSDSWLLGPLAPAQAHAWATAGLVDEFAADA